MYKAIDPSKVDQAILSPADLQAIEDDPSKIETVARMLGAVNLDNLFRHMQNPDINPQTRIEFQKMLNKMGRLEPDTKLDLGGSGPQVVINITRAKDAPDGVTIDGSSEAIIDEAIATFDELIEKVNARDVENHKTHFKGIASELESKGRAMIEKINAL